MLLDLFSGTFRVNLQNVKRPIRLGSEVQLPRSLSGNEDEFTSKERHQSCFDPMNEPGLLEKMFRINLKQKIDPKLRLKQYARFVILMYVFRMQKYIAY